MVCSVAGWGDQGFIISSQTLREVELEIQSDKQCNSRYSIYDSTTQICAGNPTKIQNSFQVRSPALPKPTVGVGDALRKPWAVETRHIPISSVFPPIQSLVLYPCGKGGGDERLSHIHLWT